MPDAPTTTDPPPPPAPETPSAPDADLGDKGEKALDAWKQRARAAEADAKKAKALEAKLAEFEDRDKTEAQKLADRATAAEKEAASARSDYLRLKVGALKGLAPEIAERLKGNTEEEMSADADALLGVLRPSGAGTGSFDAGVRPSAPVGGDMNQLIRRAAGRA